MGSRRQGREAVLQMLFQLDLSGRCDGVTRAHFWQENPVDTETQTFANRLLDGVMENLGDVDATIGHHSANWKLHRMAAVDRNVLRLAIYELTHCDDIPTRVTLNEAIEIAKKFGSEDSGAFVNGILDQIARKLKKTADTE